MNLNEFYASAPTLEDVSEMLGAEPKPVTRNILGTHFSVNGSLLIEGGKGHFIRPHAQRQYEQAIGLPANEKFRRALSEGTMGRVVSELHNAAYRINSDKPTKAAAVRFDPHGVFALLSDQYLPFDNTKVWASARAALANSGLVNAPVIVSNFASRDHRMNVRLSFPNTEFTPPDGYSCWIGIDITNAEDGSCAVKFSPSVFRLVCLNGMTSTKMSESVRKYHKGKDTGRIQEAIFKVFAQLPIFAAKARVAMEQAYERSIPEFTIDQLDDFQAYLGGATALSKDEAKGVFAAWQNRAVTEALDPHNALSLSNAVSFYAHEQTDLLRQSELEGIAGRLVSRSF